MTTTTTENWTFFFRAWNRDKAVMRSSDNVRVA